ncbi:MAG: hypothetical protein DWQ01_08555 [Planctomycetota bacterium]|nr:MAG: hypothetical protein DWQ01_08555 [Planctomycetota bacterium]
MLAFLLLSLSSITPPDSDWTVVFGTVTVVLGLLGMQLKVTMLVLKGAQGHADSTKEILDTMRAIRKELQWLHDRQLDKSACFLADRPEREAFAKDVSREVSKEWK